MATCKYCGKSGLLLRINAIGACPDCAKDDNINLQEAWERYANWENKDGLYRYYRKKIIVDRSMTANGTHLMRLATMFLERGLYEDARKLLLDITRRFPAERPVARHMQFVSLRGLNICHEEAIQQLALSYLYAAEADEQHRYDRDAFIAETKTVSGALGWTDDDIEGLARLLDESVAVKCFIESPFIAKYALYTQALKENRKDMETENAPETAETEAPALPVTEPEEDIVVEIFEEPATEPVKPEEEPKAEEAAEAPVPAPEEGQQTVTGDTAGKAESPQEKPAAEKKPRTTSKPGKHLKKTAKTKKNEE